MTTATESDFIGRKSPAAAAAMAYALITGNMPKCIGRAARLAVYSNMHHILNPTPNAGGLYLYYFTTNDGERLAKSCRLYFAAKWLTGLGFTVDAPYDRKRQGPRFVRFVHADGRIAWTGRSGSVYMSRPGQRFNAAMVATFNARGVMTNHETTDDAQIATAGVTP